LQAQHPIAALGGIAVVMMLIALDQTVVGTALPQMVSDLQGFGLYPWVAAAFLLTNAIFIPVTGRLGDLYGRKPFLLAAITLFTAASVLCGLAQSMLQLVLARGLQGIGGGMLIGSAFASVSDLVPDTLERVRWQVVLSASFGVASALGPVLGGVLTQHLGWRSVFYVNLPVGLIALPVVWRFLPWMVHHHDTPPRMDWGGVALLTVAVGTLQMATEMGEQLGFASVSFWGLVALSLAFWAGFVHHQRHTSGPVIPPQLFESATVRQLAVLATLTGLVMFVLIFYAPLLLQGGFGLSPKEAGLLVTPLLVGITIGSIVNGRLIQRMDHPERLFSYGVVLLIASMLGLCACGSSTPAWLIAGLFGLAGFSLGFQLPNLTLQMQSAVTRAHQGAASALIQTLRSLGSMFGASVAGLLVSLSFTRRVSHSLPQASAQDSAVTALLKTPQILVRAADQTALHTVGQQRGLDVNALLDQARQGLVWGIREALLACVAVAVVNYFLGRKLPPFVKRPIDAPSAHAE
jgi:EmrB/QacA subfamily drug resistance transporter